MFGKAIGIDLGTTNVLVYVKGRGVVLNEPSVVAYSEADNRVLAVGRQAREMLGRSPDRIQVVRPMRDGVIADYTITEAMLRYFIRRVSGRFSLFRPIVMICIPAGVTNVESRAVRARSAPGALARLGHEVDVLMPRYRGITAGAPLKTVPVFMGGIARHATIHEARTADGVRMLFADCPEYFDREFLYGSLTRDVYSQAVVLGRKYRLLRLGYNIFMYGVVASVIAFVIASVFFK